MGDLWNHTASGTVRGATKDRFVRTCENGLRQLSLKPLSDDPVKKYMNPKILEWLNIYDDIITKYGNKTWLIPDKELDKLPLKYRKWILNGRK